MKKITDFIKTPKGMIITGIILLVLIIIAVYNWDAIKAWFILPNASTVAKAKIASRTAANRPVLNLARCENQGGGDCKYHDQAVSCSECAKRGLL